MNYLIIGAGGTGGALGGFLAKAGRNVTMIARGAHLAAMKEKGLTLKHPEGTFEIPEIQACTMEEYAGETAPDVIFVCVKGYSIEDVIPFIKRVAGPETVVIPILNIYGTGGKLQQALPGIFVTDGCIYVASQIEAPGVIKMNGKILRVVFGVRQPEEYRPVLKEIEADLCACGILGELSDNIRRDALMKFSYVSAHGACGLYYNVTAGAIQEEGEIQDCFVALIREVTAIGEAMGIKFEEDLAVRNVKILKDLAPVTTTSMQRDVDAGKSSEIDGLIYEVVRLGEKYNVPVPVYTKIADEMHRRGLK